METDEQRYARAKKRVEELKAFYIHLSVYLFVNAGLFLLNVFTGGDWWFYWPLLGWGIGLTIHAASVFLWSGSFGSNWEERKIQELMERDR